MYLHTNMQLKMKDRDVKTVKLGIAIPTYNEVNNISRLIKGIKAETSKLNICCEVLIIDDNSPDGTGKLADNLAKKVNRPSFKLKVLHRKNKNGFDKAYIAGFNELLKDKFDYIMQMDADLSHNPKYLPIFLDAAKKADLVVGSRYIKGGGTPDWTFKRRLLSRFGNIYARIFLGSQIHDFTGGYNLYTKQQLVNLNVNTIKATGYGFLIELKYKYMLKSNHIVEIPIVFKDRTNGNSKIPKNTMFKNLLLIPNLLFKNKLI